MISGLLHLCSDTSMVDLVFGTKRIGTEFAGGGRCGRTEEDGLGGEFVGDVEDTEDFLDLEVELPAPAPVLPLLLASCPLAPVLPTWLTLRSHDASESWG